jgi:hypothetical protein
MGQVSPDHQVTRIFLNKSSINTINGANSIGYLNQVVCGKLFTNSAIKNCSTTSENIVMKHEERGANFWMGNALLGMAMIMLLYMGYLWELMGIMAMGLWIATVIVGAYLLMSNKSNTPKNPD